jgi:mannose-1-phosphate guanylyltransferase
LSRPAPPQNTATSVAPLTPGLFSIERFVEKPDAATAARYVAEGYVWDCGNFVFRAGFLLDEYRRFEPESGAAVEVATQNAGVDLGFVTLEADSFGRVWCSGSTARRNAKPARSGR